MPTNTYTPLATVTLTSAAATVTFSSIPGTYRDLILEMNHRLDSDATDLDSFFRFNGDTGTNYNQVVMRVINTTVSSTSSTTNYLETGIDDTSIYTRNQLQIFDYAQTDKHKSGLMTEGLASYAVFRRAFRWASTSAITSISITAADRRGFATPDNFAAGSVFSLYAIAS